jgi:steroid delta-isomerase-like uncharacterized protein
MSDLLSMVHGHYDALNHGDMDAAVAYFADDVETITPGGTLKGLAAFRAMGEAFLRAVPEMHHDLVRSFEDGDTIVVEGVYSGTQTGPFEGPQGTLPASGNAFAFPYVDVMEARDGKCVSHRVYWDNVSFLSQIGAIPAQ